MLRDAINCIGTLRIYKRVEGDWKLELEKQNKVVNTGLAMIGDRLQSNSVSALSHIAVGTGATAVTATDTALQTELFRKAIDTSSTPGSSLIVSTVLGVTEGNGTYGEVGTFNASSGPTMFNRINVTYTKNSGEEVKIEFTFNFTAST